MLGRRAMADTVREATTQVKSALVDHGHGPI